tara:strand:- start:160 stop:648 length:489 start_codon:yes stop_codon:yes gene_type:complete
MQVIKQKKLILLTLGIFTSFTFSTTKVNASSFGAEIFCTMRDAGNDHESSWDAAYSYIKKQKGGFFKVSPKNAAAQITETVIREKDKFSYCVEYLDNLHPNRQLIRDLEKEEKRKDKEAKERQERKKRLEKELEETNEKIGGEFDEEFTDEFTDETLDRYSY